VLLLSVVVFGAFVYLKRLAGPVKEKKKKNLNEQAHILHVATYITLKKDYAMGHNSTQNH
jgi:hypothetical protein